MLADDTACRDLLEFDDRVKNARSAIETEFIDDNRTQLEKTTTAHSSRS